MPGDGDPDADDKHVAACKEWQKVVFDGGWAGITWPVEAGGRGGPGWQQRIFNEEQSHYNVATGVFAVGIAMAGPTIIAWGTPEQQERFLPAMLRGDDVWCQLFSEPGAGSDLAGSAHARRSRRRGVGRQRPEGVDVGRALQRLGHPARAQRPRRAEAQGHHRVPARHAHARHRRAAAAPDQRRVALQRGVPHRRAHSRRDAPRSARWRLARREHDAVERTGDDRRRRARRLPRHRRARASTAARTKIRSCARSSPAATRASSSSSGSAGGRAVARIRVSVRRLRC